MFRNLDLGKLFDTKRLFAGTSGPSFEFYKEFVFIFCFFLLIALVLVIYPFLKKMNPVTRKLVRRIRRLFTYFSLSGLLWLFFRSQKVYIFSSRSIFYLFSIISLIWLGFIIKYYLFSYKKELHARKKQELIKKYIPKPKKR